MLLKEKLTCIDLPLLDRLYLNHASVNWTLVELCVHSVSQSVSLLKTEKSTESRLKSRFEENVCRPLCGTHVSVRWILKNADVTGANYLT